MDWVTSAGDMVGFHSLLTNPKLATIPIGGGVPEIRAAGQVTPDGKAWAPDDAMRSAQRMFIRAFLALGRSCRDEHLSSDILPTAN